MPQNSSRYLFVYGTLMTGGCRHSLLLAGGIRSITPASVRGSLFHLGEYPGMTLSAPPDSAVQGELIEFEDLSRILPRLDAEEGSEYRRELVSTAVPGGGSYISWAYLLEAAPVGAPIIESGDWRHF